MIYVGIDIASEKHDYFMLQQETGVVFSRSAITIPNSESGYKSSTRTFLPFVELQVIQKYV